MDKDKLKSYLNSIISVLTVEQLEQVEEDITQFRDGIDTFVQEFETVLNTNEELSSEIDMVKTELTNSKEKYYDLFKNGVATIQKEEDDVEETVEEPVKTLSELIGE